MAFLSYMFDYNGVLVDDESVHLAAFREVLTRYDITVSDADYQSKYLGFDDVGAFRAILEDNEIAFDASVIRSLVEAKKPAYLNRARLGLIQFPGAGSLLTQLASSGAVIGIVSGALQQEIELGLRMLGVLGSVSFVVSAENTRAGKPDPEGYRLGRSKLMQVAGDEVARRVLVVEDSIAGIQAAVAADMPCLAVAHSYEKSDLMRAGAVDVVARIADIDNVLLASLAARVYGVGA
jgi:beta-phosphoglucomutase